MEFERRSAFMTLAILLALAFGIAGFVLALQDQLRLNSESFRAAVRYGLGNAETKPLLSTTLTSGVGLPIQWAPKVVSNGTYNITMELVFDLALPGATVSSTSLTAFGVTVPWTNYETTFQPTISTSNSRLNLSITQPYPDVSFYTLNGAYYVVGYAKVHYLYAPLQTNEVFQINMSWPFTGKAASACNVSYLNITAISAVL